MTIESKREFASIEEAIADIRAGRIIVVVDDEDRENEGDFLMAADKATPEAVNFMIVHGRGLMCMPVVTPHPSGPPSRSAWTRGAVSPPASRPTIARSPSVPSSILSRAPTT